MKGGLLVAVFLALSISACSSEDSGSNHTSSPPPVASAEGLWTGIVDNNRSMAGVVLEDGTYWFLYSMGGNPAVIAGLVQGNGTTNADAFTSSNGKDLNTEGLGVFDLTVAGNYVPKQVLNGTVTYPLRGQTTFTSTYDTAYELSPDVSQLLGTYTGSSAVVAGVEAVTVTISAPNILTGPNILMGESADGCRFSGEVFPRRQGNAYDVSVTFSGGVCSNGTSEVTGIAFFNAATKTLYSAALNSAKTNGYVFVGTKP
jgi:hypothetical protein